MGSWPTPSMADTLHRLLQYLEESMFFYVTRDIKIGDKRFVPCVQYKLTKELEATVTDLVAKGRAVVVNESVMFYNGAPVYPKKPVPVKNTALKKGKKGKK